MAERRFTFRLEPVRTVRKHTEQLAMKDLAVELGRAAELERRLEAAQRSLEDARRRPGDTVAATELAQRQLHLERVEMELRDIRERADLNAQSVDAARNRLELAARDCEVLDRLEDRHRAEYVREARRTERVASDEAVAKLRPSTLGGLT